MTEHAIRCFVQQHSYEAFGMRYALSLEWVAMEEGHFPDPAAKYLLRLELNAAYETTTAPMQMHVVVGLTDLSDLPDAIDAALCRPDGTARVDAPPRLWADMVQRLALAGPAAFGRRRGTEVVH